MKPKQNLDEYIKRLKQITENVTINETSYSRKHYYDFPLDEDDEDLGMGGDQPAQEPTADAGQPTEDPQQPPTDDMGAGGDNMGTDDMNGGNPDDMGTGGDNMGAGGAPDDMGAGNPDDMGATGEGDSEIDVTELVNSTHAASQKVDSVLQKMDQTTANINSILQRFQGLDSNLQMMSSAISSLTHQIELMRPQTEDERRKALQQSSYPFNQSLQNATDDLHQTQTDLENQKPKFNVDDIVSGYNQSEIKNSF